MGTRHSSFLRRQVKRKWRLYVASPIDVLVCARSNDLGATSRRSDFCESLPQATKPTRYTRKLYCNCAGNTSSNFMEYDLYTHRTFFLRRAVSWRAYGPLQSKTLLGTSNDLQQHQPILKKKNMSATDEHRQTKLLKHMRRTKVANT